MGIQAGRGLRHAALLLVLAGGLEAQSWTTFHAAYQDGQAAQARGDNARAVMAYQRAIALEPTPGTRVKTYGLNFLPAYYPYLHLAEAALAQGDLDLADRALADPRSAAKEPPGLRDPLLARLRTLRQAAAAKASPPPQAAAPAAARTLPPPPAPALAVPSQATEPAPPPRAATSPHPAAGPPKGTGAVPAPSAPAPEKRPSPAPLREGPSPAAPPPAASQAPAPAPVRGKAWVPAALAAGLLALAGAAWARLRRRRTRRALWAEITRAGLPEPTLATGSDPNLGRRFGPWEARRVLGRGGCATAYQGVHVETGEEVAIKVPHPHLAQDPEFLARFRREAALGALLDHPRIVGILDPGPPEGDPWLVMPFVKGITLQDHIARSQALPVPVAVAVAGDVAEAMAHAHARGVVHRDLKPANIMLAEDGAVVMDLGIARMLEGGKLTSVFLGTPAYSAPESIANPSVGPPADRYALGLILFEMLAGHPPFEGESAFQVLEAHRFNPLPDLAAERPLVPAKLLRLVQRLCAKAPEERPEDPETLRILRELRLEYPL